MASSAEQLILRGMQLIILSTFTPADRDAAIKNQAHVLTSIGPWLADYAEEIAKPAIDIDVEIVKAQVDNTPPGFGGLGGGGPW